MPRCQHAMHVWHSSKREAAHCLFCLTGVTQRVRPTLPKGRGWSCFFDDDGQEHDQVLSKAFSWTALLRHTQSWAGLHVALCFQYNSDPSSSQQRPGFVESGYKVQMVPLIFFSEATYELDKKETSKTVDISVAAPCKQLMVKGCSFLQALPV